MSERVVALKNPKSKAHLAKKVFVVVPAFNEAQNITRVISELTELKKALSKSEYVFDFAIIDDGSKDNTRFVAAKCGATVISLPYNMGIGMSVQTGFRYAIGCGADFVIQVDGDGQHIPSEISKLLGVFQKNPNIDVVIGTRFAEGQKDGLRSTTFLRWLAGRVLAWTVHFLTDQYLSDTTSGFRLYNRRAAEFIAHDYPDDYPEVEVLVILARNRFKMAEVPVEMRVREFGHSSINWWRSIYYVFKVVFASFMDRMR